MGWDDEAWVEQVPGGTCADMNDSVAKLPSDLGGKSKEFLCEPHSALRPERRNAISLREEFNSFNDSILSSQLPFPMFHISITEKRAHSECLGKVTVRHARCGRGHLIPVSYCSSLKFISRFLGTLLAPRTILDPIAK
jgi:hypothetical protein